MAGGNSRQQIEEALGLKDANEALIKITQQLGPILDTFKAIALESKNISNSLGGASTLKEIVSLSKSAAKNTQELTAAEREQQRVGKELEKTIARINSLNSEKGKQLIEEKVRLQEATRQAREYAKAQLGIKESSNSLNGSFKNLISNLKSFLVLYFSIGKAVYVIKNVFNLTRELDSLDFTMRTVIKTEKELAQTQTFLSDISQKYGLDLIAISERYIKFRAASIQSNMTARDTMQIFNSVAKAASVLGLKTDEVSGVFLALEQMLSKGKVTTEELRRQLGERLPGAFGIMADALGVTLQQLDKMLKAGTILSADALPKFAIALEKAYGIEAVNKVDTLAAAQGRLKTAWVEFVNSMEGSNGFKYILNQTTEFINAIRYGFGGMNELERISNNTGKVGETFAKVTKEIENEGGIGKNVFNDLTKNHEKFVKSLMEAGVPSIQEAEKAWDQYVKKQKALAQEQDKPKNKTLPFNVSDYKKTLSEAESEFETFTSVQDGTLKKSFLEVSQFVGKNTQTYSKYLQGQQSIMRQNAQNAYRSYYELELKKKNDAKNFTKENQAELATRYDNYQSYVKAQAEIEKLLKGKKTGNQFTPLEKTQAQHKQELDLLEQQQYELLSTQTLTDDELKQRQQENAKELLQTRIWQISEEKKITGLSKEQLAKLDEERAEIEKKIAKETSEYLIDQDKRVAKEQEEAAKKISINEMSDTQHNISLKEIELNKQAALDIQRVANAKDAADKIRDIELSLSVAILNMRKAELQAAINSGKLTVEDKKKYHEEIDKINVTLSDKEIDASKNATKETTKDKKQMLRDMGDAVNEGAELFKSTYDAQLEYAKQTYDRETKAAGDNIEEKILAERKYQKAQNEIRRKQDVADRAQAIFNIGLSLATATAKLNVFQVAAAALAMASVLAKPVPQYFKGTKNAEGTFIAGEHGTEAIIKPSGEVMLTPNEPTLFSDNSFVGSTILPHDKTLQMLQSYSIKHDNGMFIDMSKTNKHLETLVKNSNNQTDRFIDAKGNLVVKRGNITTHYANSSI